MTAISLSSSFRVNGPLRFDSGNPTMLISRVRLLLPPATKLGQGYVFTRVCDSVHRECYPSMHCRWYPSMPCRRSRGGVPALGMGSAPGGVCSWGNLLWGGVCSWGGGWHPHPGGYCCGWYASYWNAFLFMVVIRVDVTLDCVWYICSVLYPLIHR